MAVWNFEGQENCCAFGFLASNNMMSPQNNMKRSNSFMESIYTVK
jgi:hypothetical protein